MYGISLSAEFNKVINILDVLVRDVDNVIISTHDVPEHRSLATFQPLYRFVLTKVQDYVKNDKTYNRLNENGNLDYYVGPFVDPYTDTALIYTSDKKAYIRHADGNIDIDLDRIKEVLKHIEGAS